MCLFLGILIDSCIDVKMCMQALLYCFSTYFGAELGKLEVGLFYNRFLAKNNGSINFNTKI